MNTSGKMAQAIKVTCKRTQFTERVHTPGQTVDTTLVRGIATRCTEKERITGPTAGFTKECTRRTKNKATVNLTGPMAESIRDTG